MTGELFGFLVRWWAVIALAWVTMAFLMCGLTMVQRKIQGGPDAARAAMKAALYTWPWALANQLLAWLTDLCSLVFDPDTGPVAAGIRFVRQAGRNYRPPHPTTPPQEAPR